MKGGKYGKVDIRVMKEPSISATAKCIYACISCFANNERECYPTRNTLVQMTGLNPTTFDKYMKELVDRGIVTKEREKIGNLKGRNHYRLNDFNYYST